MVTILPDFCQEWQQRRAYGCRWEPTGVLSDVPACKVRMISELRGLALYVHGGRKLSLSAHRITSIWQVSTATVTDRNS